MGRDAAESLRNARLELEEVGRLLLSPSPDVLYICEQRLAKAVEEMESGRPFWKESAGEREAVAEARSVRRMVMLSKRLLEKASFLYAGWRRIRADMDGQYRADGSLHELACRGRILVQG